MATLHVVSSEGIERVVPLARRITTVGASAENDVALPDADLPATALHIHFDGRDFNAACHGGAEMLVNGRRRATARLADGDRIRLGRTELRLSLRDRAPRTPSDERGRLEAMEGLVRFSERLLSAKDLVQILDELLDAALEATHAEKGFLVLLEEGRLAVKAARNLARETLADASGRISDSIVQQVLSTRRPVVVADALHDAQWSASTSVANLKLCSVMCAPLLRRGEPFGALYLGNDSVVSLFGEGDLDVLTVYAAQASLLVQNAMLLHGLRRENDALKKAASARQFGELVGYGAGMGEVYRRVDRVAGSAVPVLLTGEAGTGKELAAREIHQRSSRSGGPFVTVSCSALTEEALAIALFGAPGGEQLAAAPGGTLFLDDVHALPPRLQDRLARALEPAEGAEEAGRPRVLAATERDLAEERAQGRFSERLYHSLATVIIALPPLRARGDDVVALARLFLQRHGAETETAVPQLSPDAIAALGRHTWPGNVRELQQRIRKAALLAEGALIGPEDLDLGPEEPAPVVPLAQAKEEFQRRYIDEVLARNGGNRTKAAKDLGVDPRTIFRHLEKHDRRPHEPAGDPGSEAP